MKHQFRIILRAEPDDDYPFKVEKKGWFFWHSKTQHKNMGAGKEYIVKSMNLLTTNPTEKVLFEYSEEDHLAEKLKGNI